VRTWQTKDNTTNAHDAETYKPNAGKTVEFKNSIKHAYNGENQQPSSRLNNSSLYTTSPQQYYYPSWYAWLYSSRWEVARDG